MSFVFSSNPQNVNRAKVKIKSGIRVYYPSHEEDSSRVPVLDEKYKRVVRPEYRDRFLENTFCGKYAPCCRCGFSAFLVYIDIRLVDDI